MTRIQYRRLIVLLSLIIPLAGSAVTVSAEDKATADAEWHKEFIEYARKEYGTLLAYLTDEDVMVTLRDKGNSEPRKIFILAREANPGIEYTPAWNERPAEVTYKAGMVAETMDKFISWSDLNGDGVFDLRLLSEPNKLLKADKGPQILLHGEWIPARCRKAFPARAFTGTQNYLFDYEQGTWIEDSSTAEPEE